MSPSLLALEGAGACLLCRGPLKCMPLPDLASFRLSVIVCLPCPTDHLRSRPAGIQKQQPGTGWLGQAGLPMWSSLKGRAQRQAQWITCALTCTRTSMQLSALHILGPGGPLSISSTDASLALES